MYDIIRRVYLPQGNSRKFCGSLTSSLHLYFKRNLEDWCAQHTLAAFLLFFLLGPIGIICLVFIFCALVSLPFLVF